MKKTIVKLTLLLSFCLTAIAGLCQQAAEHQDIALVGAKIYPSPTDPPIENGAVIIREAGTGIGQITH
jgi:hypothetical protein